MKILSVTGEQIPPGKGGSPADTFTRSIATYVAGKETKTLTVTYPKYFEKVLAEKGIYDQEAEGVPVNHMAAALFLEKHPDVKTSRQYFNDEASFLALFEGFSLASFKEKYGTATTA
ncbi:hypothetical protein [Brevibacillus massiliensis]|jgi:hypothetical protein|uniref:hypothetical protein n=1 Tax=Brevibacillus massiliensis TaxID=1118054 RepID=UPI0003155FDE|nr:hypothetical protein [Brevibacillus massiliensis]